jgi:hypothetical protein
VFEILLGLNILIFIIIESIKRKKILLFIIKNYYFYYSSLGWWTNWPWVLCEDPILLVSVSGPNTLWSCVRTQHSLVLCEDLMFLGLGLCYKYCYFSYNSKYSYKKILFFVCCYYYYYYYYLILSINIIKYYNLCYKYSWVS